MPTFYERKAKRKKHYEENVKGWKLRPCSACNGSGYYDHNDSPDCGACDGTGKERYNPEKEDEQMISWILTHGAETWTMRWWNEIKDTRRGKKILETERGQKVNQIFQEFMKKGGNK